MEIIDRVAKVRVPLGALVVLITALALGVGCGQAPEQSSALEEQQRENEKLQQSIDAQQEEIEAQQEEQERAEEEAEEAEREEMRQENEELQEENERLQEENEQRAAEPQQTAEPEPDSPDVIIESNEDWTAPPSEAYEGVVVVSPDYDVQAVTTDEAYALDAAIAYYQQVEIGDYYATHDLLSVEDQARYSLPSWVEANTNLDSAAGEFVVTGAYPDSTVNPGYPTYAVTLTVYLPDGSSFDRTTYFTDEGNGYWAHWLSQEEMDLFDGAL